MKKSLIILLVILIIIAIAVVGFVAYSMGENKGKEDKQNINENNTTNTNQDAISNEENNTEEIGINNVKSKIKGNWNIGGDGQVRFINADSFELIVATIGYEGKFTVEKENSENYLIHLEVEKTTNYENNTVKYGNAEIGSDLNTLRYNYQNDTLSDMAGEGKYIRESR